MLFPFLFFVLIVLKNLEGQAGGNGSIAGLEDNVCRVLLKK